MQTTELLVHSSRTETKSSREVEEKYCQERKGWRNGNMRNFHLIFYETSVCEYFDIIFICAISEGHKLSGK